MDQTHGRTGLLAGLLLLAASFWLLYRHVIQKLVYDWGTDDNYSHGFLIVPIAAYLAWERRDRLAAAVPQAERGSAWSSSSAASPCSWRACWAPSSS